jgi:hypothetical protein
MADEGVWLSTQPFTVCNEPQLNDVSNAKLAVVCKGTEFVYKTIKKFPKLKVTYGTDIFNDPVNIGNEIKWMDRLSEWHSLVIWASRKMVRSLICCWLMAIRWRTSRSSVSSRTCA